MLLFVNTIQTLPMIAQNKAGLPPQKRCWARMMLKKNNALLK
jgi:hypothetical protein